MRLSDIRFLVNHPDQDAIDELSRAANVDRQRVITFLTSHGADVVICSWSGRLVHPPEGQRVGTEIVHRDVFEEEGCRCDRCSTSMHDDDVVHVEPNARWCERCAEQNSCFCCVCEDRVETADTRPHENGSVCSGCVEHDEDVHYCDCSNEYRNYSCSCNDDYEDEDSESSSDTIAGLIRNYLANVIEHFDDLGQPTFRSLPGEVLSDFPMYLGVELEVHPIQGRTTRRDAATWTQEQIGSFTILKADSSIPYGGFEIVSLPATLAYHRQAWAPFLKEAHRHLQSWLTGRAGLHVHISRSALSSLQLGKMMVFVNEPANSEFISQIAGRAAGEFCMRTNKNVKDGRRRQPTDNRYESLTVSGHTNAKTVELRIFRGNLKEQGFFRCLDFTVALTEFCSMCSIREARSSAAFCSWMADYDQCGKYPYLANWLSAKGMIAIRRPEKDLEPA